MTDYSNWSVASYTSPRFYTNAGHPFDEVEWFTDECGYQQKLELECPKIWDKRACDMVADKYIRKADVPFWIGTDYVPATDKGYEHSIKQLIHRVAFFMSFNAYENGVLSKESAEYYYLDLCYLLLHRYIGFNTPAWLNAGLYLVYGIEGSSRERYWFNPQTQTVETLHKEQVRPGLAACFLTKVEDQLHGPSSMYDYINAESKIFTMGAGNGANISAIRGKGEPISGGGIAEGIIPFLKIPDRSAAYIKSGGVSRRAARMLVCDADHPDVLDFITWKGKEEKKVFYMADSMIREYEQELLEKNLPQNKIDQLLQEKWKELIDWRGDLYDTVAGQTANNSVRCPDAFFKAVEEDGPWQLRWRTDPDHVIEIPARKLWDTICLQAWTTGDPGIMFDDTIQKWNTVPHYGEIVCSNPCQEILQPNFTTCNLCSIDLLKFIGLPIQDYIDACAIVILSLETVAHSCSTPTPMHARTTYDLRPLGANLGNVGAVLMRAGLPYDSEEGRELIGSWVALMTAACWKASADIAGIANPYPAYDEKNHYKIIKMHKDWASKYDNDPGKISVKIYKDLIGRKAQFRNDAVTAMVPMGTIGLVLGCDTTGIEPDFSLTKYKSLSGGGGITIVNESVAPALRNLGYDEDDIPGMVDAILESQTVVGIVKPEHEAVFDCAQPCSSGRFISYTGHIDMVAEVQRNISLSISKTVNLHKSVTTNIISDAILYGWRKGLKGIAVYRDGSKYSQPLNLVHSRKVPEEYSADQVADAISALQEALK